MCRVIPGAISANKTAETWSHRAGVLAVNSILLVLTSLVAAFQCYGLSFLLLLKERRRQQEMTLQAAHQYNAAVARLRYIRRRVIFRRGRLAKLWSHRAVVAEPLQRNSAQVRVEEKCENGSWCIYSASRWNTALPSAWQKPKRTWCALSGKAARFDFVLFKRPRFAFYDSKCFWNRTLYRTFSCSDPQILSLNTLEVTKKVVH